MEWVSDILNFLITKSWRFILPFAAIVIFSISILVIFVNRAAEPGERVSFLWGAVEYTKKVSERAKLEELQRWLIQALTAHRITTRPVDDCGYYLFSDAEGIKKSHILDEDLDLVEFNSCIQIGDQTSPPCPPYASVMYRPEILNIFNQIRFTCEKYFADETPRIVIVEPVVVIEEDGQNSRDETPVGSD